ncbi:MAG: hypothetical protein GY928_02060 [Colwellia sp.]|nr:hypothetical protein [Colwellia sp.]
MNTKEKLDKIFNSPHSFNFETGVFREDSEWYKGVKWVHVELPMRQIIKQSDLLKDFDECLDDCLDYITKN